MTSLEDRSGFSIVGFRTPPELRLRLERIARAERNGLSAVVRRLLSAALDANERRAVSDIAAK